MSYELKQEDIYGLIANLNIRTRQHGNEMQFEYCPYCYGGQHKDQWTFSINTESGAYNCTRGKCGKRGRFEQICRDFEYELDYDNNKKYIEFPQPRGRIIPREGAYAYLEGRGISRTVAEKYQVTAFEDRPNILWFPFFDEHNKLVYAKFRKMDYKPGVSKGSKEWQQKDGKPILFGMNECEDFATLVITEGQIDSMSCAEAGIKNAVSVPCGKTNFSWIANCKEWVKKFETIIVFGDMENGQMSLLEKISQKFDNKIKAVRQQDYLGEKDANAILKKYGADAIRDCINNAQALNAECVKPLSKVKNPDIDSMEFIETGIRDIDEALDGGIALGQVCILSGKRGDGKSTFMSQVIANAIEQDYGTFIYSAELPDYQFKGWLNTQVAGEANVVGHKNKYGKIKYAPTNEAQVLIDKWYDGKAFIFDNTFSDSSDKELDLINVIEQTIKANDVKLICIDNLMTAMESIRSQSELYIAQGRFVGRLKKLVTKYNVAAILVVHPRKSGKDTDKDFDNDDVAGSADITNKADIVLNYYRPKKEEKYQRLLSLEKNRLTGVLLKGDYAIHMYYNEKTRGIISERSLPRRYGWEQRGADVTAEIDVPF